MSWKLKSKVERSQIQSLVFLIAVSKYLAEASDRGRGEVSASQIKGICSLPYQERIWLRSRAAGPQHWEFCRSVSQDFEMLNGSKSKMLGHSSFPEAIAPESLVVPSPRPPTPSPGRFPDWCPHALQRFHRGRENHPMPSDFQQ